MASLYEKCRNIPVVNPPEDLHIVYANVEILVWVFIHEVSFMLAQDCDGEGAPAAPVECNGKSYLLSYEFEAGEPHWLWEKEPS